jgi:cation:H+ antiporter
MHDYLLLIAGVLCAAAGGELFVRSTVQIAAMMRVSPAIVGATFAAFSTSSPEFAIAVTSAAREHPQIALGDASGSSVVNIALILGLAMVLSPVEAPRESVTRDFPFALAVPVVTAVVLLDGILSPIEGLSLLAAFVGWLMLVVSQARRERSAARPRSEGSGWRTAAAATAGLALLLAAGWLIVEGATGIARVLGMTEFVIAATIVAIGTSAPELATTVVAKLRGHDEVGLGTLLGSNIFNGLLIVPTAAVIHPITIEWREVALALGFGVLAMLLAYPPRSGVLGRPRGLVLLLLFAAYTAAVIRH